ncbi:hypothetical protein Leryth_012153 [Lithospermum erythrorhizon]|nr:hypothetical protein Leryth_012153 [Lithospermum erythrorhizon]
MPELFKRDSILSNSNAMTWWTSTGSQTQPSSVPRNLSFKMAIQPEPCHHENKLDFQVHDQKSASTHSSEKSYPEVACEGETEIIKEGINLKELVGALYMHLLEHSTKTITLTLNFYLSGPPFRSPVMEGKTEEGYTKSTLSSHDYTSLPLHFDYGQPIGPVPLTYPNNLYPGVLAAYGPHAMVHPQMMCMTSTRVPLPLDLPQHEPIFVNARQYHAIMRRRQYRAKLEAQNKVSKDRKPYLHESRHRHALNRARGPGGRFLNVKKVQESINATSDGQYSSGFGLSQSTKYVWGAETHQTEDYKETNPAIGSSGITCASNADTIYHHQDYGYSVYASPDYEGSTRLGVGCFHGSTQHFLPVPQ